MTLAVLRPLARARCGPRWRMADDDTHKPNEGPDPQAPQPDGMARVAGGFAHNFNNLLTVITGNLQLVEMRVRDESLRSLLREASLACAMGARMTQSLLTYAQQRRLAPTVVDVNAAIRSMRGVLKQAVGDAIDVVLTNDATVLPVLLDQSEFESAVLNIVLNARDAMPGGGVLTLVTGTVSLTGQHASEVQRLPPGRYVRLSIRDTGTGMTPQVLARALEPFFSTKDPDRGTGLGLATVQGFIEQSGGAIELESSPREGTSVTLYMPAV